VTEREFPPDQRFGVDPASYRKDSSLAKKEWLNVDMSEFAFSGTEVFEDEQPLIQLTRIAAQLVSCRSGTPEPLIVPLLNHLVAGARSCALFYINPIKRKLYPTAVANFSREFICGLADEEGEQLLAAAEQEGSYLVISLPDNREFESLGELFYREGIRTLCLFPLREDDGSVFGLLLFASRETFSPSVEAVVSVALFTAWMSVILRQTYSETFGDKSADGLSTGAVDKGNVGLRMYRDKHGIPVTYDATTHKQKKQAKSDAISVLSHELLSPLTLIKGYTATMLQLSNTITDEQKEQYLQGIDSASNRVIRLLENLRDITRLEETDTLTAEPIYLSDLLRATVSEIQSQTTKHIIKLSPSIHIPRIRVDAEKIEQVISNLLVNAVKYSPQGGDIETEISVVHDEQELRSIFADAPPVRLPCLVVSIADNGIGIPEAELDLIFDKFYRISTKLTRTTPGAGLGLYICKIIVEAHGGSIWSRNRPHGGSIFYFSLPME
jgi:signal transduction histidine kinase